MKSKSLSFTIKATIWKWPGEMPWHFVNIDKEISKQIRDAFPSVSMVKISAQINDTFWNTSLFRNNRDNNYLLPIKKEIRKKESIQDAEIITVTIKFL